MSPDQIAAIAARLRAATPGPWGTDAVDWKVNNVKTSERICTVHDGYPEQHANGRFIANAPTDIAALLAEVARLRVELQASRDNFRRMVDLNKEEQKLRDNMYEMAAMMKAVGVE